MIDMNAEVRYAKESPQLINFAEAFKGVTRSLSRAYTVPDSFYEQPASMERFEKGVSINNAQEFLDHTLYDADKAAGIVDGFVTSQILKDVGMTVSADQLVTMRPDVKKTMGRSLTIAALAQRAARLEALLTPSSGIPEAYGTAQTQVRLALGLVERAAKLAYDDWNTSWGKLSVDNALAQASGTVTRQKLAQAAMVGVLALAGCGPISVSFTPEIPTGQGTTPRSTEVVPAMTETSVLTPTATAESTQPGELTCSVEVQSELFNKGITDDSRTVPVLSGAGFTEVFGSDVPLMGITNQIANDVAGLVRTAPEGITRVIIPDGIRPEDIASGVSQLTGSTRMPFEIATYENGMVLGENDLVVVVHAGKGGWTTGVWKEASLVQDQAGRNQINGLLLESVGGIFYVIPGQQLDNGHAAIAIVDGCGPSIVRVEGDMVNAVLNPAADMVNNPESVWKINLIAEIPMPAVPENVITGSLGLINAVPVKEGQTGDWVITDMSGKTFWRWDNDSQVWQDERPLYWQCGRGIYFVPSDYSSTVSEEAKVLPTGLMTDGETPFYPVGGQMVAEHVIARGCITELDDYSNHLIPDISIVGKITFFDVNGKSHEYNFGRGYTPSWGLGGISFFTSYPQIMYKGAVLDKASVWLLDYYNNPDPIASRQISFDFLTEDLGIPSREMDSSSRQYLIKNRDITVQLIEALKTGRGFPEDVPEDFFLNVFQIGFLGNFKLEN